MISLKKILLSRLLNLSKYDLKITECYIFMYYSTICFDEFIVIDQDGKKSKKSKYSVSSRFILMMIFEKFKNGIAHQKLMPFPYDTFKKILRISLENFLEVCCIT